MAKLFDSRHFPLYAGALAAAALLLGFGLLADEVAEGDTLDFDKAALAALREPGDLHNPIGPPWLEEAARDITALGSFSLLFMIVVVVAGYLMLSGRARTAWFLVGAVIGGTLVSTGLKMLFDRPRPDLTDVARIFTASFPSGHATLSAVVFLTIGALLAGATEFRSHRLFYLGIAILLTLLVGLTRIYLGVHYPTDVLAGWSIGTAWALLCWVGLMAMRARTGKEPSL